MAKAKLNKKAPPKKVKKKVPPKKTGGRPTKYKPSYPSQAYEYCLLGATDAELADQFEVNVDTIHEWKKKYPEFSDSIKRGKYKADAEIAQTLYNRAKGMTLTRQVAIKLTTKRPFVGKDGKPTGLTVQEEEIEIVTLEEQIPPDNVSIIFWLKNRQPAEWREKQEIDHTTKGDKINQPVTKEELALLSKEINALD
jgi:hypothetical protein